MQILGKERSRFNNWAQKIDGDRAVEQVMQGTTSTATKVSHGEFELVQQSKRFVPGSLVGTCIKDIDFVGRSEAETP